ncbi:PKD domain-containing protein, partial [Chryseobacterium sp. 2TAF14]|uniref:PKD domain-containing protein n=1 Tax=Chryseobacterium sp. 2TAF14 TaxID=3233007 RepID=UPI003F93E519
HAQSPLSKFSAVVTGNSTINFSDESTGNPTALAWEFSGGNPSSSTAANPSVSYAAAGNYLVKLTVTNSFGSSTISTPISVSEAGMIDLCTGRYDDGTLMTNGTLDSDWTYTNGNGSSGTASSRYDASGWSYPQLITFPGPKRSTFITSNIGVGLSTYVSKSFTIPANLNAIFSLETLAWDRQTTYLVKENTDGTTMETLISNSSATPAIYTTRNTNFDGPISEGNYRIKVVVDNQRSTQRNSASVAGFISLGLIATTNPVVEFTSDAVNACKDAMVVFSTTENTGSTYDWTFTDGTNVITATGAHPSVVFAVAGYYDAELKVTHSNGQISILQISDYIQITNCITTDYTKSPNSYIFDPSQNNAGLYIPVKKAYVMWSSNEYLREGGTNTPIPSGTNTASLYWEDVPGLIKSVALEGIGENAKIKVLVDKKKGKGNAVVSYKVNDQIYWSWHVWVTDDPTQNGSTFSQQFETDINNQPFQVKYLDRNLGATSKEFLGNEWNKSGGLMYQWGRKDPIPTFVYKDYSFYEIYNENGTIRHKDTPTVPNSTKFIDNTARPYDEIGKNIKYSVQNPLTILHNTDSGTWFSKEQYRNSTTAWDLWADNYRGGMSNASSSNTSLKADSKSYELKSSFDPCPNGWRVPSHYGRITTNNNHSPFGRYNSGVNDDTNASNNALTPTAQNTALPGAKVYPGLGYDFRENSNRNLGVIPVSGNYEYYPNDVSPNSEPHIEFQDEAADGAIWEATYAQGGTRAFKYISEPTSGTHGSHKIFINELPQSKDGNAVRCMKDPNLFTVATASYGATDFPTEFVPETDPVNYFEGELNLPNSYMIANHTTSPKTINIPIKKAFSVFAKYFPEDYDVNFGSGALSNLKTAVLWTDNNQLISQLSFNSSSASRNSELVVNINPQQYGNAVVILYNGNLSNPQILWSWHIWATDEEVSNYRYTNDSTLSATYHIINPTPSRKPPLTTTFMDRNLGAVSAMPTALKDNPSDAALLNKAKESGGLHFQWGRKDPIPSFIKPGGSTYSIYKGITEITPSAGFSLAYTNISSSNYLTNYTENYNSYSTAAGVLSGNKKYINAEKVLKYSVKNPLTFLYHNTIHNPAVYDWISDENGLAPDRWGHADKKSPFDPCPQGWRVPDVMAVIQENGSSPWYNGKINGNTQHNPHYIGSNYGGVHIESAGIMYGWILNNPNYNIGNFPNTSFRGNGNTNTIYTNKAYTGVWSSGASQHLEGNSIGMRIKTESGGHMLASGDQVSPQTAMNVRCAKDEPRYLGMTPIPPDSYITPETSSDKMLNNMAASVDNQEKISLYPNPVTDILTVKTSEPFNYIIYGVDGKKVISGSEIKSAIDISALIQGNYIIDIITKKSSKSLKFIKK